MDPWANHLNQAYGRLPPGTGLSSAPTFHLLADQQGFGTASGLGANLSNPLPAHAATRFTGLTHMNYGTLHGSMTPLFDPMTLSQTFSGGPSPYKTVPVVQTMYSLDPSQSGSAHDTSAHGRFVSQNTSQVKSMLFNTDPHTMNDASGHSGISSGAETAQATWNRLGFAPANPYDGLSGAAGRSGASRSSKGSQEPPPAHSGSRPSAIHRTTYQAVQQAPSPQLPSQPRSGHTTHQSTPTTVYNTSVNQDLTPPTAHANAQRLAEIDIVQKLLLGGQKFCIDNSSGASRYVDSASIQAKQQLSRGGSHRDTVSNFNNQQVGYSISPQLIPQQAGRSVTVVRSMPQQLSYAESPALSNYSTMSNYSDRGNASTQSYSSNSAAQMDSYDSISPPEQFAHGQAAAAAILVAQQSAAAALRAQQAARPVFPDMDMDNVHLHNQLQSHMSVAGAMGGNLDVNLLTIQALADSTTKPKRIRGGKGTSAVCTPTLSPGKVGSIATKTSVGQGAMAFSSVPLDAAKDTGGDGDSMLVGRKKKKVPTATLR